MPVIIIISYVSLVAIDGRLLQIQPHITYDDKQRSHAVDEFVAS